MFQVPNERKGLIQQSLISLTLEIKLYEFLEIKLILSWNPYTWTHFTASRYFKKHSYKCYVS